MSDSEFLKALREFSAEAPRPIEYRIYYDPENGKILDYTTDDLPGKYIIVNQVIFQQHRFDCKIENGQIVEPKVSIGKLSPADNGTPCHPDDVTIIVDRSAASVKYWKNYTHEES